MSSSTGFMQETFTALAQYTNYIPMTAKRRIINNFRLALGNGSVENSSTSGQMVVANGLDIKLKKSSLAFFMLFVRNAVSAF